MSGPNVGGGSPKPPPPPPASSGRPRPASPGQGASQARQRQDQARQDRSERRPSGRLPETTASGQGQARPPTPVGPRQRVARRRAARNHRQRARPARPPTPVGPRQRVARRRAARNHRQRARPARPRVRLRQRVARQRAARNYHQRAQPARPAARAGRNPVPPRHQRRLPAARPAPRPQYSAHPRQAVRTSQAGARAAERSGPPDPPADDLRLRRLSAPRNKSQATPLGKVTEGNLEKESDTVPGGELSADQVRAWANLIVNAPKEAAEQLRLDFGTATSVELLRQLAGWAKGTYLNDTPRQAYESALRQAERNYLSADGDLQKIFVSRVAALIGEGSGEVKYHVAQWHVRLLKEIPHEGRAAVGAQLAATDRFKRLLSGPGVDEMLERFAGDATGGDSLRMIFTMVLRHDSSRVMTLGDMLGRYVYTVANASKDAPHTESEARGKLIGRVLANLEIALADVPRESRTGKGSTDEGALIVNRALRVIDILTGGLSGPVTSVISKGVEALKDHELLEQARAGVQIDSDANLRTKFIGLAAAAFQTAIDPNNAHLGRRDIQARVTQFRTAVDIGRDEALKDANKYRQVILDN